MDGKNFGFLITVIKFKSYNLSFQFPKLNNQPFACLIMPLTYAN